MKPIGNDVTLRRNLYFIMAAIMGAAYTLYCFVIFPVLTYIGSDIAFEGTAVPVLVEYLGKLVEALAISVAYAIILCGVFEFSSGNFKGGLLVFVLATLYKYAGNVVMDWATNGSVPASWIWDIVNVLFFTALETVQLLIVWTVIKHFAAKAREKDALAEGGAWYPFGKIYDKSNPCLRASLFCALIVFLSKIFGLLVNDIYSLIVWGLPKKAVSWVIMSAYYLGELLFGIICYVVIIFTVTKLMDRLILKNRKS